MKERLTGAIILVAFLVLLVPELLTGPESLQPEKAVGAEAAQLRSYTIDLQDDAADRQPPSARGPAVAVPEETVGRATPEAEDEVPAVANVSPPVDEATRAQGRPMGSGADSSAAIPGGQATGAARSGDPGAQSAEDDRPHSAFGPNARPQQSASADKPDTGSSASRAAAAKAEAAKAEAARAAAAKAEAAKAEAARVAAAKAAAARAASAKSDSAKSGKGWAVQLGVFGNRDNAERLAKRVKGSGFPVLLNETSGKDGKKLYWVRVGPEPDQAGAVGLSARLKAAGYRETRVVEYP